MKPFLAKIYSLQVKILRLMAFKYYWIQEYCLKWTDKCVSAVFG
jgi:hypothetical protein